MASLIEFKSMNTSATRVPPTTEQAQIPMTLALVASFGFRYVTLEWTEKKQNAIVINWP